MRISGAGLSLGETIVNSLLFGAGILAFVSILERVLIEVKPRLSVIHYVLDGLILILIASTLTASGALSFFAIMVKVYPWQANLTVANSLLSGFLAYLILGPYVVKTSIFVAYSLWKRVRAGRK
jgi:hypothetical protein